MRASKLIFVVSLAVLVAVMANAAAPQKQTDKKRKPFGIDKRVPFTTSKIVGTPDPPPPYVTEIAFPNLKFFEGLEITTAPGLDRLFVAERPGKVFSFPNSKDASEKKLLVDVGKTVYGLAFHPKFQENGYFYVTVVPVPGLEDPTGTKLIRYQTKKDNRLEADPQSATVIIEWPSGGHNGGCLAFGPDGYLYIATGDGSGIADEFQTGQNVKDLLGSMLRIDVDHPAKGKNYGIPADNPFVGRDDALPEIYAYGLRQTWKFSFDTASGELWAGEIGQDLWEMVLVIEKGGNYGWSVQEGTHPFRPDRSLGPSPILKPVVEHSHVDFRSITGGFVYHGKRLPELSGTYIYGDYDSGRIWGVKKEADKVIEHRELADTPLRIVDFAQDHQGEIYAIDFAGGRIHQLIPNPQTKGNEDFPRKLSDTGLFTSTKDHELAPGMIPYSVNAQLWSDGAEKERFLGLPGNSQIDYNTIEYPQPAPGAPRGWGFPDGTVVVKTFYLELEPGNPASKRRLETRILHCERVGGTEEYGDQYWRGYTYVWNDEQTDAVLLDSKGADKEFTVKDPSAPGGERKQVWHFPSRAECTTCHTVCAKYVLGLNTLQMNKDHDYGDGVANQLSTFEHIGLFSKPLPAAPEELPHLVDYTDASQSLDDRARSYLHSNCAHCHMKWGGGNAEFQLLVTMPIEELGILDTKAGQGTFKIPDAKILVPGSPEKSLIYHRMTLTELGRMPHIASKVVDRKAVELIHKWIAQLPKKK